MFLDALLFLAVTAACVVYSLAVLALMHRVVAKSLTPEGTDLASSVERRASSVERRASGFGLRIATLFSLIIGLLVATLVSDYSDSVALVKAESAELARADSALRLLDSKRAELARDKLHDYVKSVVNEWPRLRKGVPDVETGAKIRQLNLLLLDLGQAESESTPIVNEVRERVAQLGEFRARRFLSAESEGITYFWLLGFVGFAALLIQFGCFGRTRPSNFLIAVFCIMQATVFYVALVASNPFARPGAISPAMSRP